MKSRIFTERHSLKPEEYPQTNVFIEKMQKTYWTHDEVNFSGDIQDFHSRLTNSEQNCILNSVKAIGQIEVAVKRYWANIDKMLPKPEFSALGFSFAESEMRHSKAYSKLLEVLDIDNFEEFLKIPIVQERYNYLRQCSQHDGTIESFCKSLALFTLLVENVSLFGQFATIYSFKKFRACMRATSNQIAWTSVDENVHAQAGIWILNTIFDENPGIREKIRDEIFQLADYSLSVEEKLLDLIFSDGELPFLPKKTLMDFLVYRMDKGFSQIGYDLGRKGRTIPWFDELCSIQIKDFFDSRSVDYARKSVCVEDLF